MPPRKLRYWLIALKSSALLVIVGAMLSGHPPSKGQQPVVAVTAEDSKQDTDIEYLKVEIAQRDVSIGKMQDTLIKQGNDLASLDTKMNFVFGILGLLQSGGLALHGYTLRKSRQEEG